MAHYQNQYNAPEVSQIDEFGNPIHKHEIGSGTTTIGEPQKHRHGLHRTGSSSSSSSSSSDDEGKGRKKKGIKEKIKEKIPHKEERHQQYQATSTTTPRQGHHHEKKGMVDKIKEKLPGHH